MKAPVDKLLDLNQDTYARELYEGREKQRRDNASRERQAKMDGIEVGIRRGIKKGIKEGLVEGERKKALDIAQRLLEANMPIENISSITGLTIKEIEEI